MNGMVILRSRMTSMPDAYNDFITLLYKYFLDFVQLDAETLANAAGMMLCISLLVRERYEVTSGGVFSRHVDRPHSTEAIGTRSVPRDDGSGTSMGAGGEDCSTFDFDGRGSYK